MNNVTKDGFGQYGATFQSKVLTALMFDRAFLQQSLDLMRKEYFESESAQWLFDEIVSYFIQYKSLITLDVLKIKVDDIESETLKESVIAILKKVILSRDETDLQFAKDNALEFCKNQELKYAVRDSVDLMERGESGYMDMMRSRLEKAFKAGGDRNLGHAYNESLDYRMSEQARICVPTPWDPINEITDGGSSGGDLFVMVAPPGIGKTWSLVSVGAHTIKLGKNVLHYSFELGETYVGKRYDANISGISGQNLKYHKEDIARAIGEIDGRLLIKYYPPKSATVNTLRAHIEKCILQDFKPDLIIVDYADLLRSVTAMKEVRHSLENIYEDLRAMAGEFQIPVWTASQANRSSLEDDIIGAERIAEAFSKMMVADFVMSLSRKITDKIAGTGRWHVIKNRFGPDGMTFPSKINTSTGHMSIYQETTAPGKDVKSEMNKGNLYMRKLLKRKHDELQDLNLEDKESSEPTDKFGGFESDDESEPPK